MQEEPREQLTPEELQQIERVQQLILALDKCTRAQKLYLPNNKILQQQQANLVSVFEKYLDEHSELTLFVKQTDFIFLNQSVYKNTDKKESFAFRLFNEGMRAIRFNEGVTKEELIDFVSLLNSVTYDGGQPDDSAATTMLWEREFEHITYEIAEYILDDPDLDVDSKMDEILDPGMEQYKGPTTIGPPEDIEEEISADLLVSQEKFNRIVKDICVLDDKEFEQIQREIENGEKHDRLMMDLFDILMTLILDETDNAELERLYTIILNNIDGTVLNGELHITAHLLRALRGLLEGGEGDFALRHPDRLLRILDSLATKERINQYLNSLNLGYTGSVKDIVNFFASLPKRAFPILLSQIQIVASPQLRKEISISIAQLYDNNVQTFAKAFKLVKDPNHLMDLLFILSHTRDTRVVQFIQPLFLHSHRSVRLAAIATLKDLGVKDGANYLLGLLEDSDVEIRLHAIRALAVCGDQSVGRLFLEKIRGNDILNLNMQEKRSYFFGVAKLLGDEIIPLMGKLLKDKKLFRRQQMDELHQCAAFALGVVGSENALKVLRGFERSGSSSVRVHCSRELKRTTPQSA